MKKKLIYPLLVIALMVGMGLPSQTARANCLIPVTDENGNQVAFISCGSSAGNYIADMSTGQTYNFPFVELICWLASC